ncbi:uncharacterized protein LOC133298628 [Gastrolobium bilobum]|uniref:uncharacterized protein LOC133298628 n=1 Tax=Gastrolobium bilobum TaxID=150636 RepID=UPI002AB14338|nr:uncharacterized protein LOC133298628 [Gastrolobium bilobum]
MDFVSKNKMSFVNGTIPVLDESDQRYAAWERCNTMVLWWLHRSITSSISQSILWMDCASDVWKDLKERFSQSDIFRISDLQDEIYKLYQGESSVLDRDYSIRFLKGLNEQFSNLRSQIMLMDPLPSINRVFSLIVQQERQLQLEGNVPNVESPKVFFNFVEKSHSGRGRSQFHGRGMSTYNGRGRSNRSRLCTYCGKTSHTVDTCFEKHGYPPGYKQRYPKQANAVLNEIFHNEVNTAHAGAAHADVKENFTRDQYQAIMEMIQHSMHKQSNHHVTQSTPHMLATWFGQKQ